MDERRAIGRLKRGDPGGLEDLVRAHQVRAVRAAYLICRDRPLAEDVVQGAFVKAYEKIKGFDEGRSFGPWFTKMVVNDAIKAAFFAPVAPAGRRKARRSVRYQVPRAPAYPTRIT